jgi:hypothetical protein
MKATLCLLALATAILLPSCSLVTVPVKTAGRLAETTVKTTGHVLREPFR